MFAPAPMLYATADAPASAVLALAVAADADMLMMVTSCGLITTLAPTRAGSGFRIDPRSDVSGG